MDREAWQATVSGVAQSWARLSDWHPGSLEPRLMVGAAPPDPEAASSGLCSSCFMSCMLGAPRAPGLAFPLGQDPPGHWHQHPKSLPHQICPLRSLRIYLQMATSLCPAPLEPSPVLPSGPPLLLPAVQVQELATPVACVLFLLSFVVTRPPSACTPRPCPILPLGHGPVLAIVSCFSGAP